MDDIIATLRAHMKLQDQTIARQEAQIAALQELRANAEGIFRTQTELIASHETVTRHLERMISLQEEIIDRHQSSPGNNPVLDDELLNAKATIEGQQLLIDKLATVTFAQQEKRAKAEKLAGQQATAINNLQTKLLAQKDSEREVKFRPKS
jgi:hypothetical protein